VVERRRVRGDGRWLRDAIDRLEPGGGTNLHAGLMLGLDELAHGSLGRMDRRVIVLTDGIANVGVTAPDQIVADATRRAETAVDISTIGVGQNLDVPLLQRLADGCRGLFHYVADGADVQKVFVAEADALLAAVARRVTLSVTLPDDLDIVRVYQDGARWRRDSFELPLPDLNAGVTGVVMVQCRVNGLGGGRARASLRYEAADGERARTVDAAGELPVREGPAQADVEVRKNAAIAVLAYGMAEMSRSCEARRWADADNALARASDDARRLFPGNDTDVQRVREMVAGHTRTLRKYVDRFRDY